MEHDRIEVGDLVRIVNYLKNNQMPVGKVTHMDGQYITVDVNANDDTRYEYKGKYEVYPNEIVKITEQEYFRLLLAGANEDPNG
jgi:hypothetical protein